MKIQLKKLLIALIVIFVSVLIIVFSEQASLAVIESMNICLEVIIPSTFIFMVISSYILSNGLYKLIFSPFFFILRKFLKLDEKLMSIFILSLIGGYPLGYKLLKEEIAENKNYHEIALKSTAFCYCISPTFATTMLGLGLYRSIEAGLIIYFANIASCLLIAIIYSRLFKLNCGISDNNSKNKYKQDGIIYAINDSSTALLKMCTVIVFFNAIMAVFECFLISIGLKLPDVIKSVMEISNILNFTSLSPSSLPLISALASFGGLCVIFQCKSLAGKLFSFKYFFISRLFSSAISFLITEIILQFWDISSAVQSQTGLYKFDLSENKKAIVFLLIMFIIMMKKSEKNFKKG